VAEDVARFAQDGGRNRLSARRPGCRSAPYFSSLKNLRLAASNVPEAQEKAAAGELLFGNIDTFLLWNLTGGDGKAGFTQPM